MSAIEVCAHMNLGPFTNAHGRFSTVWMAVESFKKELERFYGSLEGIIDRTGEDRAPCVDLFPQCPDCNSHMNFHDYPFARYQIGPRGGIRKVAV